MAIVHRAKPERILTGSATHRDLARDKSVDTMEKKEHGLLEWNNNVFRAVGCTLLGLMVYFMALLSSQQSRPPLDHTTTAQTLTYKIPIVPDLAHLENCTVSFVLSPNSKIPGKPLWMPSYPGSGAASASKQGDVMKPIVNALSGLNAGSKNYHMSSKRLRRCKALAGPSNPTAVCTNGHPMTPVGPEAQTEEFDSRVILVIRNFRDAYPAFHNDKAIAYHGAKGQVDKNEWRKFRDQYLSGSFGQWKETITVWKTMEYYRIGMYFPFETILDPQKGPSLMQRLGEQLAAAGFVVAPPDQMPCIWYRAVHGEHKRQAQFYKYIPGYTIVQRDYLLAEMDKFIQEMSEDKELVAILKEYRVDIRDNTQIDIPWVNETIRE
jgi:hypothetical protein